MRIMCILIYTYICCVLSLTWYILRIQYDPFSGVLNSLCAQSLEEI